MARATAIRLAATAVVPLAVLLVTTPVSAAIHCEGGYQRVAGGFVSTPYCEDANLAAVARDRGQSTSADMIRHSYRAKRAACRLVGGDIRVSEACDSTWTRSRP